MYGHKLNKSYRIRLSEDDLMLICQLKSHGIKPSTFIRDAIREKIKNELPLLIAEENQRKSQEYCPY